MKLGRVGFTLLATTIAAVLAVAPAHAQQARFIVKFRDSAATAELKSAPATEVRIAKLASATGTSLHKLRDMGLGAQVVTADGVQRGDAAQAIAATLAANPDVEFAVVDHLRHALESYPVDDTYVGSQYYLFNSPTGINAFDAWTVTQGSPDVVVAVIDTGYRPHIDLAGRILPGYDMISDPAMANDGDGRDADATDPGNWVTSADLPNLPAGCQVTTSDWHGTSVAGVIAADTNNEVFTAGIDWNAKILPVRVLGRCGGYDSDVIDGMLWAAGLPVPGVPANPHPAQVLNLSLGGEGSCELPYQQAIDAALGNGVTRAIVVAAGNASEDAANDNPANCPGVIRVSSTTTTGNLAPYSNYGPSITLSAPGGSKSSSQPDAIIVVLSNTGTAGPVFDSIAFEGGTSFSAPMVSGTISLMLAVNPELSADQIESILTSTASPFVSTSDCTTAKCGAGVVNAGAAVRAAAAAPPPNYQGLWWAYPAGSESGWGINFAHQGSVIFATWFTYDVTGNAWWLSMTAAESSPGLYSGTLYATHGPAYSAMPFDPALVGRTAVGSGSLQFLDNDLATFSYTVNGFTQTKVIERQVFGPLPVCTFGGLANLAQATNYQDLWWAAPAGSESGWGINLTQQGSTIFGTWFTYDQNGSPLWLSVTATPVASQGGASAFSGTLYRTSGPAFSAAPFDPNLVTRTAVGSATLTFTDGASGTFAYTVNGIGPATVMQTKAFTREVFVSPGTACH